MSRWSSAAERNRRMVAENAERVLNDTKYDALRTRVGLRGLAVAYVAVTVAIPVCWLAWGGVAGIIAVLVGVVVYLLLRVAVRALADLPDHVLDERMRRDRDSVYLQAYRISSVVVFLAANAAFIAVAFDEGATITLDYHSVSAIYWTLLAVILGVPSVVLATRVTPSR